MDTLNATVVAASAALITAWLTSIVSEDYKRFRDGSSLAAALAGELSSYMLGMKAGRAAFTKLVEIAGDELLIFPDSDKPVDGVFDSCLHNLGLLGADLAGKISFVYHQVKAYRSGQNGAKSARTPSMQKSALDVCLVFLENAIEHGEPLISDLEARASKRYVPFRH